ncbi:Aste57867_17818 [Aphanomyces stellatus]|uniref:non-specific serine/threonine protein kinase n=1 Tax=Aphanomyces stellatus TaxID=120398 RepID=A0A485L8J1_9STRA|nr:hypothetical protein As57867_017757 [Aphanomyces stellatus]VFT94561.1 Aste57867_17818 [Aphanomyces stellatus]
MNPSDVHVLVVEDDEFTRMATIDILKSIGYVVTAVENGGDALKKLTDEPTRYDLVLCDVMLPVLNGIQLLECVQKEFNLSHIPIVMTSSNEEMDVVTSCLSKGAKDYLIKPIQYNTAKTLVRHVWLSRKSNNDGANRLSAANNSTTSIWRDLEVLRTIGKGTHGTVVLARRRGDGAVVAVKRVRLAATSENGRKQADNEVILLKSLYHVNIVRFYDSFIVDNDELNIVMEFSDGGNLRQVVKLRSRMQGGYFPEPLIMSWFAQLVLAVSYIHGKNVLHRDLKAQNVFLTKKHVVKLGDFGISKALSGDDLANTSVGTPESMSPEICRGERYGKKSDIWSLGCVLYEMTMLKRPFEAQSLPEMFTKICHGEYDPIPTVFSKELRLLIQLMLQQDPSKRPSIEDICRFPFVQAPIQAFLSDHAAEFELALQTEAKMNQAPQADVDMAGQDAAPVSAHFGAAQYMAAVPTFSPTAPEDVAMHQASSLPSPPSFNHSDSLREMAISSQVVGLGMHKPSPFDLLPTTTLQESLSLADRLRCLVTPTEVKATLWSFYPMVVTGQDLLDAYRANYLLETNKTPVSNDALLDLAYNAIHELMQSHAIHLVYGSGGPLGSADNLFRFQIDQRDCPLNMRYLYKPHSTSVDLPVELCLQARALAAELHTHVKFPAGIHLHWNLESPPADTSARLYRQFLQLIAAFQATDISKLTSKDRQVFFINIYNTMVLHGLIEIGLPQTSDQYKSFERDVVYLIGGMNFSLGDIRHGILRCNRKPPSAFWGRQFEAQDPRLAYCFHTRDPRSLLVLLEQSPPFPSATDAPILKPRQTDTDLEHYMRVFCQKQVGLDPASRTIRLPKVLRVYLEDFGSSESELINWLAQYMDDCPRDIMMYRIRYASGIVV